MTKKIDLALLIDDEEIDQRYYKRVLDRSGLVTEFMSFTYADDALEFLLANPNLGVDVILLDINMPRMNGFEVLERLKQLYDSEHLHPNSMIAMMYSSSDSKEDKERAFSYDFVKDFLTKPLDKQKLAQLVASYQESNRNAA